MTDDVSPPEVDFAIWKYSPWPIPWGQRLAHIWRIIRKGDPYADCMILDRDTARRLGLFLLSPPVHTEAKQEAKSA